MANTTWYGDGLSTVAVGSRTVTGTDTGWLTAVAGLTPIKVGDKFGIHVGRPIVIKRIISDTELLLADDWPGPAQTDAPYKVELTSPTIAAVEAMRRLLASLSNGNLDSLSELSVGTDDIPIGIGPGVFGTISKFELKDGVQFNVAVPNLAGRAAYNGSAAGFRVLVADIGDGRSALYIKNSATSGDWSVPYPITGPVGPAGVNQRGNYSAGTAYAIRDIVQSGGSTWIAKVATTGNAPPTLPTTENTQWLLFARSGAAGVVDRGAYSGAAAYEANDIVLNNGSTWLALQPTTGNAPPVLPAESNAYWRLLARKGTDGTGTGDVVGPSASTAGAFAQFSNTTGKAIVEATISSPGIVGRITAGTGAVERLSPAQANQVLGGWEPIGLLSPSAQTALVLNNLSAFSMLRLTHMVTAAVSLRLQVSTDNGLTFLAGGTDYNYALIETNYTGSAVVSGGGGDINSLSLGDGFSSGVTTITGFNKPAYAKSVSTQNVDSGTLRRSRFLTQLLIGTTARNALRLIDSSGSTFTGTLFVEGIRG
jgi:hypothetical protein